MSLLGTVYAAAVLATTCTVAWRVGERRYGLRRSALAAAARDLLGCLGAAAIFTSVNMVAGVVGIIALRALHAPFISLYVLGDTTWLALSVLEGAAWWLWRSRAGARPSA